MTNIRTKLARYTAEEIAEAEEMLADLTTRELRGLLRRVPIYPTRPAWKNNIGWGNAKSMPTYMAGVARRVAHAKEAR